MTLYHLETYIGLLIVYKHTYCHHYIAKCFLIFKQYINLSVFRFPISQPGSLFYRGRGMPRGAPRGAMRGGAPRGGLGRGSAPRGAPSGRGGPPSAPARGGSAPRSRPPAAGAPRMLPSAAMSHQQHQVPPSASQPKAEAYEDYVRI